MKTRIAIHHLKVNCLIGCLKKERQKQQTVLVDVELSLSEGKTMRREKIFATRDYAQLAQEIEFILRAGRFVLLENASEFVLRYLLLPLARSQEIPRVEEARVSLTKFHALSAGAQAKVSLEARAEELCFKREIKSWGWVDVVAENDRLGLYRLNMKPGGVIDNHYHSLTRESEYVLGNGIEMSADSKPFQEVKRGHEFHWQTGQCHGYRNASRQTVSVLCVDEPPFHSSDEIIKDMVS